MINFIKVILLIYMVMLSNVTFAKPITWLEPITGMTFVAVPKGCFQMGTKADALRGVRSGSLQPYQISLIADERPQHEVCVDLFWLGQFEVRASDWIKVMKDNPPSGRGSEPAGSISFKQAQEFALRLTSLSKDQYQFRLPSEAEWEYACRANKADKELPYHGNRVDDAWYSAEKYRVLQPTEVGQLKANAWGLYDMLGNVWEWVADGYQVDGYRRHSLYNPQLISADNGERVIRGASHRSDYIQVRCGNRSSFPANERLTQIGLRLVRVQ